MNSATRHAVLVLGKVHRTFGDYVDAQTMSFELQDYFERQGLDDVIDVTIKPVTTRVPGRDYPEYVVDELYKQDHFDLDGDE